MPSPVRYAVMRSLLNRHGWYLDRIRGSHHSYEKLGHGRFTFPVHGNQVKHVYYKQAKRLCGEE
jgi:predicted RNA binding protein YcfA (HicA-like mRNA interferase family)